MSGFSAKRDRQVADEYLAGHLPCTVCGTPTERETLSEYGARCGHCFTHYKTRGKPNPPMPTAEQRRATAMRLRAILANRPKPGRGWAYALRDREQRGERLSLAQRHAWRDALHAAFTAEVEA